MENKKNYDSLVIDARLEICKAIISLAKEVKTSDCDDADLIASAALKLAQCLDHI